MSNAPPNDRNAPRTGHGAASLIPHLNDRLQLEPAHLDAAAPPDPEGADESAADLRDDQNETGLRRERGDPSST